MEIIEKPLTEIIPYERNNRVHPEQQVDRIANSIAEFGMNQPIVIDENNIILVGHGRYDALKKLGREVAPVLQKIGLTETQKKAYRILDNKLQNDSEWELANLDLELGSLSDEGFDLKGWGLDDLDYGKRASEFGAATEEEQGKLDELDPKMVKCPSCEHTFDSNKNEVKKSL